MIYQKIADLPLAMPKGSRFVFGRRGFSLVELLFVMAILVALVLMAIPALAKIKDLVREVRAMEEIRGIEKAVSAYAIDHNSLPDSGQLTAVVGAAAMVDPWGHNYEYGPPTRFFIELLNSDYDLYSNGSDNASVPDVHSSLDDIVRAGDGGFVGTGKKFCNVP